MPEARIVIPRLSETLSPIRRPFDCQRCGAIPPVGGEPLTAWQEHNDADRPETIFVLLCRKCADKVIEPHPRLYRRLSRNEPAPGVMQICSGCIYQIEGRCTSDLLRSRGGPGLKFPGPDTTVHICRAGPKGRGRVGEWLKMWSAEPTTCAGFRPDPMSSS